MTRPQDDAKQHGKIGAGHVAAMGRAGLKELSQARLNSCADFGRLARYGSKMLMTVVLSGTRRVVNLPLARFFSWIVKTLAFRSMSAGPPA